MLLLWIDDDEAMRENEDEWVRIDSSNECGYSLTREGTSLPKKMSGKRKSAKEKLCHRRKKKP